MSNISIDSLVSELETARELAIYNGNYNAAVSATLGKAKLLGLHKGSANPENTKPLKVTLNVIDAGTRQAESTVENT